MAGFCFRLTELGMVERITWANTVYKALPINVSFANTFYHPLIVGYPEKAVADWLSPWSQEKHNQSLALLTSPGNMLTVPQVRARNSTTYIYLICCYVKGLSKQTLLTFTCSNEHLTANVEPISHPKWVRMQPAYLG